MRAVPSPRRESMQLIGETSLGRRYLTMNLVRESCGIGRPAPDLRETPYPKRSPRSFLRVECQRFQQILVLSCVTRKRCPHNKNCNGIHISCIQRSPRPDGHSHALGKICRKADSICREHIGRESWPEVAFSSFVHTSRAAASRSKRIARQNDVT